MAEGRYKPSYLGFAVAGFSAAATSYFINREGISAGADSWAYWEGSVSLLENGQYTFLGGEPIIDWPPGFSLYLAFWQHLLGVSGRTLIVGHAVLTGANVGTWSWFVWRMGRSFPGQTPTQTIAIIVGIGYVWLFSVSSQVILFANALQLLFVPIFVCFATDMMLNSHSHHQLTGNVVIGLLGGALLFVHNVSITFIIAVVGVSAFIPGMRAQLKAQLWLSLGVLSIGPWLCFRLMGQSSSHEWRKGMYSPFEYLIQAVRTLSDFLFARTIWGDFNVIFLLIVGSTMALYLCRCSANRLSMITFFKQASISNTYVSSSLVLAWFLILSSYLGFFGLMNLVWIDSWINERFSWYVALGLFATIPLVTATMKSPLKLLPLIVIFTGPLLKAYSLANDAWASVDYCDRARDEFDYHVIRPFFFITDSDRQPRFSGARTVDPPTFPWHDRYTGR